MAAESKKRLALAICDFLNTSITDGTLPADEKENMEVAVQCIADSFKIDPADKAAVSSAIGSQNLYQIYSVYEKLKNASSSAASSSSASTAAAPPTTSELTEEKKKEAEALKSRGNAAMQQKDYAGAIDLYTQALAINPQNAVYLSNRSAAYHNSKNYEAAKTDALACTQLDPTYTKGWSRLGLALYALDDAKGSMEAYKRGIEAEGSGGSDTMKRGYAAAKQRAEALEGGTDLNRDADSATSTPSGAGGMPSLAEMASMFGGGGRGGGGGGGSGGGGGGGMPDFASIMSNPMFQSMAQNMMSNPDLMSNLMSNPRLREMANQFQSGGGMPDMASLMSDPSIAEMARSMMGGGGAGRGAGQ